MSLSLLCKFDEQARYRLEFIPDTHPDRSAIFGWSVLRYYFGETVQFRFTLWFVWVTDRQWMEKWIGNNVPFWKLQTNRLLSTFNPITCRLKKLSYRLNHPKQRNEAKWEGGGVRMACTLPQFLGPPKPEFSEPPLERLFQYKAFTFDTK